MLRGADLEATSRKYRVTVATLSEWRDRFLASGEAGLKSREVAVDDEENRRLKSVVRLADERVVVSGGTADVALASAEIYQFGPEELFTDTASMNAARSGHGCAVLKDGRVLVAGGGAANLELYEPSIDTWTTIDSSVLRAEGATVTPLADG